MDKKQGFAPILLIIIALVVAAGGVGVGLAWKTNVFDKWLPPNVKEFFGKEITPTDGEPANGEQPNGEEQPPAEDPTKDWKTYTNTKGNYQLKMPEGFWVQAPTDDYTAFWGKEDGTEMWYIQINYFSDAPFYNPPPGTELISWLKEEGSYEEFQALEKPNFEIDGVPAVKIYMPGMMQAYDQDMIWVINGGKLFEISVVVGGGGEAFSEDFKKTCDTMLSTFKFIE